MGNLEEKTGIVELSTWDMGDVVYKHHEYDRVTLPEPTADNMLLYLNKINELVQTVNRLTKMNKDFIKAMTNSGL